MGLLTDPQTAPLIAAVVGALLGAAFTAACTHYLALRKDNRTARARVSREIITLTNSYIAELIELEAAVRSNDTAVVAAKRAETYRLQGAGSALEAEMFDVFNDRRTRATFHKLLDRWQQSRKWMLEHHPDPETAQIAYDWIYEQGTIAVQHASKEVGVGLREKGGLRFIGFRFGAVKKEYLRDLSFDDEPPPWKAHISYEFESPLTDEERKMSGIHLAKFESMRCSVHHRAPHVRFRGKRSNFSIEVDACCQEFSTEVHEKIVYGSSPTMNFPAT